jgi:hypothetical protein
LPIDCSVGLARLHYPDCLNDVDAGRVDVVREDWGRGVAGVRVQSETKYTKLQLLEALRPRLGIKTNPAIQHVANALRANFERILDLGKFPSHMFRRGEHFAKSCEELDDRTSQIDWKNCDGQEGARNLDRYLADIINTHAGSFSVLPGAIEGQLSQEVETLANIHYPKEMLALMSSMLVATCTAFDSLTLDLLVVSVNVRPSLGAFLLSEKSLDRRGAEAAKKAGDLETLLRLNWNFARPEETRSAWLTIFKGAFQELETIFGDSSLACLHAARNAIVHSSGFANKKTVNPLRNRPEFKALREGDFVPLDGKIVSELIDAALGHSVKLLSFVDSELGKSEG